jgi:SAM-dependent methyltransferase
MKCRHCFSEVTLELVDLGCAPPSNAYLSRDDLHRPEQYYPLRVLVCEKCWLAQTEDFTSSPELFNSEYAYFSGYSTTWQKHCERLVDGITERFRVTPENHVIEVASNDGCLLQFVKQRHIPCTGIEPTASTASASRARGINTVEEFFGSQLARKMADRGEQADIMIANNVLAHVPDINDFAAGFRILLKPGGVAVFEFPHLLRLVEHTQFDTIYHEHFSYLSFGTVNRVFSANGLVAFDVEELQTHGGSLRVFAQRLDTMPHAITPRVSSLLFRESDLGMTTANYYKGFQARTDRIKNDLLTFLIEAGREGKRVAAYGAAAKGNTLLNYAGVRADLLPCVADRNPAKQGRYLPGSRIPVVSEERIKEERPDYVLILPWNIRDEISEQMAYAREWGARFVTAVPVMEIE